MPGFQAVCTVKFDSSQMRGSLQKWNRTIGSRSPYWVLKYRIAFRFGSTELKAYVVWDENVRNASYFPSFTKPNAKTFSRGPLGGNAPRPCFNHPDRSCSVGYVAGKWTIGKVSSLYDSGLQTECNRNVWTQLLRGRTPQEKLKNRR
jgi:hypothetical protein